MRRLNVYIESAGRQKLAGHIEGSESEDAVFRYEEKYAGDPYGMPISISLPVRREAFSAEATRTFFEGLLPEGSFRRSVNEYLGAGEGDYLTVLAGLGEDFSGAITVREESDEEPEPAYVPLEDEQLLGLAAGGIPESSRILTEAHMSLPGSMGKAGLYYDEDEDRWYLPAGGAPGNYIVKQSNVRFKGLVTNEKLCLMTASRLGIDVPESFIINTGEGNDEEVLFLTERFDRTKFGKERISELRKPLRTHQEDFAQALGIPVSAKYEPTGGNYFRSMVQILRNYSADPVADITKLWDLTVFNWLIGNTDGHIKNHSLLYSEDLGSIRLAPAYDLVSTLVYTDTPRRMGFNIGGEYFVDKVTKENWMKAAADIGIGRRLALERIDFLAEGFDKALKESAEELNDYGFSAAKKLARTIKKRGGIAVLK